MKDLKPGDLVLRSNRSVGRSARGHLREVEQQGQDVLQGTRHRTLTYGLVKGDLYEARRPTKYHD